MISLAEAVKLKSILNKKTQELISEIHSNSHSIVEKGEQPKQPDRTLSIIEAELVRVRKDARLLDKLIYKANIENTIQFKDEQLTLVEAIELAIQLRSQVSLYQDLGRSDKEEFYHSSGEAILYRIALYDPTEYRNQANELEKEAHRLSNAINAKNYQVQIEFDDSNYF
ncbi:DIP1984 family protein [Lysinibacillus sp. 54212]|uniref:DIP1984 family protein n=1 Tax=Lysinibacillus sp. 54212 TaxID=3119829 RepID=UPI002FC6FEAA